MAIQCCPMFTKFLRHVFTNVVSLSSIKGFRLPESGNNNENYQITSSELKWKITFDSDYTHVENILGNDATNQRTRQFLKQGLPSSKQRNNSLCQSQLYLIVQ